MVFGIRKVRYCFLLNFVIIFELILGVFNLSFILSFDGFVSLSIKLCFFVEVFILNVESVML